MTNLCDRFHVKVFMARENGTNHPRVGVYEPCLREYIDGYICGTPVKRKLATHRLPLHFPFKPNCMPCASWLSSIDLYQSPPFWWQPTVKNIMNGRASHLPFSPANHAYYAESTSKLAEHGWA